MRFCPTYWTAQSGGCRKLALLATRGPVTSSAGAATTVSLTGEYAKAVRITITPLGTAARMSTLNNVVLTTSGANSFDVYLFDAAGTQVASSFNWDFEGF